MFFSSPSAKALAAGVALSFAACGGGGQSGGLVPPSLTAAKFSNSANVTNTHFPLVVGTSRVNLLRDGADRQTIVVEVLATTRVVQGVTCAVVNDRVFEDGLLLEDVRAFYAQDDARNVWFMGEEVAEHEYDADGNLVSTRHDGTWEAGKDLAGRGTAAQPGFVMPGTPKVGDTYFQTFYPGEAEDTGEIVALSVPVTLASGTTYQCLKVRDASRLSLGTEFKYYAPGIGKVREEAIGATEQIELLGTFRPGSASAPNFAAATFSHSTQLTHPRVGFTAGATDIYFGDTADGPETIIVERLDTPRTVAGIACAVVRDRVFRDGLLIEDTRDFYAQDDAGNVWYLGEEVDNHEYDENGNLVATTHEGSWVAGLDLSGTGAPAQAGFLLQANPTVGDSYHQEFYSGEATDMGFVVATDADVELDDGRTFAGCLQVLDWNPLHPAGVEYKFFAPGVGFVHEESLHDGETLDHTGRFNQGAAAVPNFAAATFAHSTTINHPHFPLPIAAQWTYRKQTSDGLEETTVVVQSAPHIVLGIACTEALYTKRRDGRIEEVARDWYAQDDAGNVWYMGEAVDNHHYDAQGTLVNVTHEGSWQGGLDLDGTGQPAKPGLQMPAATTAGRSYYQEFYPTAAEDMGFVVATGLTLSVGSRTFANCLQTLDWNPLEPDTLEYKFYAPGIGLVLEHHVGDDDEAGQLTASSLL